MIQVDRAFDMALLNSDVPDRELRYKVYCLPLFVLLVNAYVENA
jgi:hypothetical protein